MKKHFWTDATFEENLHCGYGMISCEDLGKPSEEITYYEAYYHCDMIGYIPGEFSKGYQIPMYRNTFTIEDVIAEYQGRKTGIDSFAGMEYTTIQQDYTDNPYLILNLSSTMQQYCGWLTDGYPYETYTLTEIKRLLGAYN